MRTGTKILLISTILLLIFGGTVYEMWRHEKQERKRIENNYNSERLDRSLIKTYTVKEFQKFEARLDSIARSVLDIKTKNLKQVITYDYVLVPDTVPVYSLYTDTLSPDTGIYHFRYDYNCLSFAQKINMIDKQVEFIEKPKVQDEFIVFNYDKREKEFRLFKKRIFRYGQKLEHTLIYSKCLNDTIKPNQTIKIK